VNVIEQLRDELTQSKKTRDDYTGAWQENVVSRRGKATATEGDDTRSMVPVDWTITKTKAAQLYSQTPLVRLTARHPSFDDAVPVFAKIVNDLIVKANVEAVMTECVVDCINAAGIGAAVVRYEALTDTVEVPAIDMASLPPEAHMAAMQGRLEIPKVPTTRVTDRRFSVDRVSPTDLLWPKSFRLSDWDKSPWLGHSARGPWAKVKRTLNLRDEDKDKIVGASNKAKQNLSQTADTPTKQDDTVEYDEVFYWRYLYHEDEKYFDAIQRVVFVAGLDEPVINEPWTGQQFDDENGGYLGSCLLPIRVLTLAYISDEAIPPSDSAVIRPLVNELQQARQDMKNQRRQSRPMRWFDVDRVDPTIARALIDGTWQGMIPTIGQGDKVLGEVAKSQYPRENHEFDQIYKRDIQEATSVGPNQAGQYASGERSASEAQIVQQSFQTEIGFQRAKVAAFFVGIAEVLAGLWALFGEIEPNGIGASIGQDGEQRLESWDRQRINQKFVADVRADSTVRLDAQQLLQQLTSVLNITAQSGFINPKPLIKRILELNGVDPAEVLVDPQPKGPEPPRISYSFKGEDLANPIVLAIINKTGQGPAPEDVMAAQKELLSLIIPIQSDNEDEGMPPTTAPIAPGGPAPTPPAGAVEPNPEVPGEGTFPNWEQGRRVITRRAEG
jgi:hypothetical protein